MRMTESKFKEWVAEDKKEEDLEEILHQFERRYGELDADDRAAILNKTRMFINLLLAKWDDTIGVALI